MAPKRQKTIEEQYMKLTQLEHILFRPDSYVGSIESQKANLWVCSAGDGGLTQRDIHYVPGLYKIFDEILVNACDNFQRDPVNMTHIKIEIDDKEGRISVENNGASLPIEMHQEHQMYVPEMVFGHLLTSDNYDDDEKKTTGGRNGYGAKLANIFSTKFQVECAQGGKHYQQTWQENMKTKQTPKVSAQKGSSFTKITFWPDFKRFGMKKLDKDMLSLMQRRCYDIAGTTPKKCNVYLNGKVLEVKDFRSYVDFYVGDAEETQVVYEQSERWEVAMALSDGQFQQVSFVNGISTPKGGTHVAHVADQLVEAIMKRVEKGRKGGMEIKAHHIRNYMWLFVNCKIENPTFDSQSKETMTLKQAKFGSKCDISDNMISKVLKTGIVDMILEWAKAKEDIDLGKTLKVTPGGKKAKRLLNIPKLEDANLAGGREGPECTLILTEGDSAKSLAVAGLSIIGRDRYGVFPLRGKLLNVRDASFAQTTGNAEIAALTKILGIEPKKSYKSTTGMRYGHVMIMTDQDYDGSHIKGLILNLVQHWWPGLFAIPNFLCEFVTPIVKVTRRSATQQFFTLSEYDSWRSANKNGKGWHIKYYKGLGTSTTQEAKEYFRAMSEHSLSFERSSAGDDDEWIDLAFNKKRADDRKGWINAANDEEVIDHSRASLTYSDFVTKELVQFAKYDVMRAIPNVVDGFKPVQRKIMWAAFKRGLKTDTKVAQFAGYVAEKASYHHGEVSLQGAIVSLAQNFLGSNNVQLLTPSGQFGTRLQGGKDHASARYIYTRCEKVARLMFHPADDPLLKYINDEGQMVEPNWYIPVLPTLLVNGADGIGTGWSTFSPNFNPRDIIANLRRYMRCQPLEEMCPWYRGFKGSILPSGEKESYDVIGVIDKVGPRTLEITELPVRKWTQDYKETLQGMLTAENGGPGQIDDFKEYHTESSVHFVITVTEAQMAALEKVGLDKAFKLRTSLSVNNMMFFDRAGRIRKYMNERDILEDFAELRLEYYQKRKAHQMRTLRREHEVISEKARFIQLVISEKIKVKNRKKDALIEDLRKHKFRTLQEISEGEDLELQDELAGDVGGEDADAKAAKKGGAWDYLLGMPLWSLTNERILDLESQLRAKKAELDRLEQLAPEELWDSDLDAIVAALDELDAVAGHAAAEERAQKARVMKRAGATAAGLAKRQRSGTLAAAIPPTATNRGEMNARALAELQERQLARTVVEFPGLFDHLLPETRRNQAPALAKTGDDAAAGGAPGRGRPRKAEEISQSAIGATPAGLCEGAAVVLHGLQGAAELNGKHGTLRVLVGDRWEVDVENVGPKLLKPENIRLAAAAGKSSGDVWDALKRQKATPAGA